jgi:hypothetical protein
MSDIPYAMKRLKGVVGDRADPWMSGVATQVA